MKNGADYPLTRAIALLVAGDPGSGKTNLCLDWPDPYVIDCEANMKNAIERHPGKRFWYDSPETGEDGKPLLDHAKWARVHELVKNFARPEVKTGVIDGLGRLTDYLKEHLVHEGSKAEGPLMVGGMRVMTKSLWGPFADKLKRLIIEARSYNKPFVLTSHLTVDENELTSVKEQRVNLQGQLKADFPKLFTDFWATLATPITKSKDYPMGVRYYVRTVPTSRITLKCSCGLPDEFETRAPEFQGFLSKLL